MAETFTPYVMMFVLPTAIDAKINVVDRIIDIIASTLTVVILILTFLQFVINLSNYRSKECDVMANRMDATRMMIVWGSFMFGFLWNI